MTKAEAAKRAVKVWLVSHGKTQIWLAHKLHVHHSQLSRVLSGYEKSQRVADGIFAVTGVSLTGEQAPSEAEVN